MIERLKMAWQWAGTLGVAMIAPVLPVVLVYEIITK
jgi:hypothetical protein